MRCVKYASSGDVSPLTALAITIETAFGTRNVGGNRWHPGPCSRPVNTFDHRSVASLGEVATKSRALAWLPYALPPYGGKRGSMSVRDQEQRAREAACKADKVARRIDLRMREAVRQENQITLRAEEVERRIEVGDVQPCPSQLERRLDPLDA